ncbi:hypothetical protein ACFE04_021168 [Oxalis oulophora]
MGAVVGKRSVLNYKNFEIHSQVFLLFILICAARISYCATNTNDVVAINRLYAALGLPKLPGWVQSGGDLCGEAWQGVICNTSNFIESITLNVVMLGGVLGDSLGMFDGIITFFLSANQFNGNIPNPVSPLDIATQTTLRIEDYMYLYFTDKAYIVIRNNEMHVQNDDKRLLEGLGCEWNLCIDF